MQIRFVKTIQFTTLLKAGGRLREFNFNKKSTPEGEIFTVNVCDDRGDRIFFSMHKEQNQWRFINPPIFPWIIQNEDKLSEIIEEELAKD